MNTDSTQQHSEKLTHEVLERILRDEIKPVSKTYFTIKNILFWTLWVTTAILGALAVAVLIFTELNIGWEFYEMTHQNAFTFFVHSLPYLWVILLAGVILMGIYNLRHTKSGYRYPLLTIVLVGLVGSGVGGVLLHSYGIGAFLDEGFGRMMPLYTSARSEREGFWNQPDRGLYTGIIAVIDDENELVTLTTADGVTHVFNTAFVPQHQISAIEPNIRVRIMATSVDGEEGLSACRINEWEEDEAHTFGEMHERRQMFRNAFENIEERIEGEIPKSNPCASVKQGRGMKMYQPPMPVTPPEIK